MVRFVRSSVVRLLAVGALVMGAAVFVPAVSAATTGIDIAGFAFAPQTVTVKVGDTVTWSNADARSHTSTADDGTWDTGTIGGNTSASITVTKAGTFAYHCKIHPDMTGTLVVEAAAAPPPTDTLNADAATGANWTAFLALAFVVALATAWRRSRSIASSR
jgi:plastocyanin